MHGPAILAAFLLAAVAALGLGLFCAAVRDALAERRAIPPVREAAIPAPAARPEPQPGVEREPYSYDNGLMVGKADR